MFPWIDTLELPYDSEFPGLERLFSLLTQLDPADLPENYRQCVEQARVVCRMQTHIFVKYGVFRVEAAERDTVRLGGGFCLTGTAVADALRDCELALAYVLTLKGYGEAAADVSDMMFCFCLDAWGSAYAQTADRVFRDRMRAALREGMQPEGQLYLAAACSPGERGFALENQDTLFRMLAPGEIGVSLTAGHMMQPEKSLSSVAGISSDPVSMRLAGGEGSRCLTCGMNRTCPAAFYDG